MIHRKNIIGVLFLMLKMRLRPEEIAALNLRELYEEHNYLFFRMSRFEEYDFYAGKKDFLTSKSILTFTDINGKLMALRPDVTLSIIKHAKNSDGIQKFYYDEKVYRVHKNSNSFREISQTGIECIGNLTDENINEVVELAILSLRTLAEGRKYILDISHAGMIAELLNESENRNEILKLLSEKNIHGLKNINAPEKIIELAKIQGNNDIENLKCFEPIIKTLRKYKNEINIDFSNINNLNYYNGIIFRGYIEGIPESILSGGEYDNLMRLMGNKNSKAIGFAVYLDEVRK